MKGIDFLPAFNIVFALCEDYNVPFRRFQFMYFYNLAWLILWVLAVLAMA